MTMALLKNIALYLVIGFVVGLLSHFLKSVFLSKFLHDNIVSILINLLAINIATGGVVLTKLKEISLVHSSFDFSVTYNEISKSIKEQILLIVVSFLVLIFMDSKNIKLSLGAYHTLAFDSVLLAILIFALDILRDTGMSIFKLVKK